MSLHAQISSEAQTLLAAQKRNSTVSSILISFLMCALIGILLFVISLKIVSKNNEVLITRAASTTNADPLITKPTMPDHIQRKPVAPTNSIARLLNSKACSPLSISVSEIMITEPSLDFVNSDDFGKGEMGNSNFNGNQGISIPASMQKRCS